MRALTLVTRALAIAALTAIPALPVASADPVLVFPGMEIRQDGHVCTLGYVDTAARLGYSAGHCHGNGPVTDAGGTVIGSLASYRDNTPGGTTVSTDQVIADYEVINLADDVATNDILPDGRRLQSDPVLLSPGQPVCHFGIATGESCGIVESVNNGWFTMTQGVISRPGDSGGPVYVVGEPGSAQIIGLFTSVWGESPAAVSWSAVRR